MARGGLGSSLVAVSTTSRPRILLSTGNSMRTSGLFREDAMTGRNYSLAVAQVGGLPTMTAVLDPALAPEYAASHDGLLLTGGVDIDPGAFGATPDRDLGQVDERRDQFELALYAAFRAVGKPILGICRGIQIINVAEGGTLHQHLPAVAGTFQHDQRDYRGEPLHPVTLESDSALARAFGRTMIKTNSYHHQAVDSVGAGLRVVARAGDGVVEAVEAKSGSFVLGVQWHPEMSFQQWPDQVAPFRAYIEALKDESVSV